MRRLTMTLGLAALLLAPRPETLEIRFKPRKREQYRIGKRPLLEDEEQDVPRSRVRGWNIKGSGSYERAHNRRAAIPKALGPKGTEAPKVPPWKRR